MLLAIDTSTSQIGLALYDGTSVLGEFTWRSGLHHTQELAPMVAELLKQVGVSMVAVTALGVALGPGSFTSLRVGLAFAKGLALAIHVPIVSIPTLEVVAASVPLSERRLAALVQAGRGHLALGWYSASETGWQADEPPRLTTADALAEEIHEPVIICGEMTTEERHRLERKFKNVTLASPAQCVRRPGILAELAWQKWLIGKTDPPAALAPIYLHMAGGLPA